MSDLKHKLKEFYSSGDIDKLMPGVENSLVFLKINAS